jgi:hypothetical protein
MSFSFRGLHALVCRVLGGALAEYYYTRRPFAENGALEGFELERSMFSLAIVREGPVRVRLGPADYRPAPLLHGRCSLVSGPIPERPDQAALAKQPTLDRRRDAAVRL